MLFQIPLMVVLTNGLSFINRILFIITNIFFLLVGQKNHEKREKINDSHFFILLGAINIVWLTIELTLMDFVPILSLSINEFYAYMLFFVYSPAFLIDISTFGVLLIIIALRNEATYGNLLMISAISSLIHTTLALISTFLLQGSLLIGISPTGAILIVIGLINIISMIFLVIFNIFLMLYSYKIDESYLKIAALMLTLYTLIAILSMILAFF